jgi:hypothetical protein
MFRSTPSGFRFRTAVLLALCAVTAAAPQAEEHVIAHLGSSNVSLLDWGLYRLEAHLNESLSRDLINGEPVVPPPQVTVRFDEQQNLITIEVGRTLMQTGNEEINSECRGYVEGVRHLLGLDKLGRPFDRDGGDVSNLADKFFASRYSTNDLSTESKRQLDESTFVQVLITVPITGQYAVCKAGLRDQQIQYY